MTAAHVASELALGDLAEVGGKVHRIDEPGHAEVTDLEGISGPGDNGGPAYVERDGVLYVIGVSSAQDARPAGGKQGHYNVLELYVRVSHYAKWIEDTIRTLEPTP